MIEEPEADEEERPATCDLESIVEGAEEEKERRRLPTQPTIRLFFFALRTERYGRRGPGELGEHQDSEGVEEMFLNETSRPLERRQISSLV